MFRDLPRFASANELQRLAQKACGKLAIVAMDVTDTNSQRGLFLSKSRASLLGQVT